MNKKIIALFCVVVLIASIFAACGKTKLYTQEINGVERPVVTNENGEVVTNKDGEVAVYATNDSGEQYTAEDGSPNINYIKPPMAIVNPNNTITTDIFTIKIPDGWKSDDRGRIYKNDTDLKCYIDAVYSAQATEENTFEAMMDQAKLQNNAIIEKINSGALKDKNYAKAEMKSEKIKYLDYDAEVVSCVIYDNDGNVVHYAANIYFIIEDGKIYSVNLACVDGVGYDKDFDFVKWASENVSVNTK